MTAKNPPVPAASRPAARLALVLAAVAVLFAVVVGTSRAHLFGDTPALGGEGVRRTALDTLFYLAVLYVVAVGALIVWAFWPDERIRAAPLRRRSLFASMVVPLAFTLLMGVLLGLRLRPLYSAQPFAAGLGPGGAPPPVAGSPGPSHGAPGVDWLALGIVAALLAVAALAVWRRLRRGRPAGPRTRAASEPLASAVELGLRELRSVRDPREAVIAAYAAMERTLASGGVGRRAPEAPFEYLARVMEELDLSRAPAERLTDLFETARFSLHELGEREREEAIAAFEAVRDELEARRESELVPA